MKSTTYKKGKLHLHKQAIATLSVSSLDYIKGGNAEPRAWSTSIGRCTGVFCCDLDGTTAPEENPPVLQAATFA
ncbi:hypothetical protein [Taibaiella chishuiensis]|uniref:Uncharacterized protein n=1 Tax=Taibaiella chishuiensis TaxID=1434707 RepID=A0A2P8D7X8_9BACT|nr:hypothetical protein [Taibaiella chishuiensis]PSK93281.1 hypothetical protein B0I18_102251 [Taibaiella chishuiensis]